MKTPKEILKEKAPSMVLFDGFDNAVIEAMEEYAQYKLHEAALNQSILNDKRIADIESQLEQFQGLQKRYDDEVMQHNDLKGKYKALCIYVNERKPEVTTTQVSVDTVKDVVDQVSKALKSPKSEPGKDMSGPPYAIVDFPNDYPIGQEAEKFLMPHGFHANGEKLIYMEDAIKAAELYAQHKLDDYFNQTKSQKFDGAPRLDDVI